MQGLVGPARLGLHRGWFPLPTLAETGRRGSPAGRTGFRGGADGPGGGQALPRAGGGNGADEAAHQRNAQKAALAQKLDGLEVKGKALETEREVVIGDQLKRLALEKQATQLRRELMRGRENQFFDAMRLDVELEEQVKRFAEQEKLMAKVQREFVIKVVGNL